MKKIITILLFLFIPSFTYAVDFNYIDSAEHTQRIENILNGEMPFQLETKSFSGSLFGLEEINQKYQYAQQINLSSVTRSATGEIISYQNFNPVDFWIDDYTGQFNRTNQLLSDIRLILVMILFFYLFFESRKILRVLTYNKV